MICNRCGAENDDDLRFCQACGHKLRSRERAEPEPGGEDAAAGTTGATGTDGPRDVRTGPDPGPGEAAGSETRLFLASQGDMRSPVWGKLGVAWALALVLCGVAVWSMATGTYWPLYPLTGLAALLAWRRRL
ncbi:zinc ribbon domain-containing protein [Desulfolutivibrio sp.]|uniref:zinc ribbon domain-containing protein n=1 Tax=Desulfolutivibrio sp. TaxID=2773296 RepID=UPI002F961960